VETVFGFGWPYLLPSDLLVTLNGVAVTTVLASPNQVVINPAPAAGVIIRIYRNTPAQNPTYLFATGIPMLPKYIDGNNKQLLYALQEGLLQFAQTQATANEALARATAAQAAAAAAAASAAQQAANIRRTIRVGAGDPELPELPPVAARANKLMGFDAAGNPVGVIPLSGSGAELALDLANAVTPGKGSAMVGLRRRGAQTGKASTVEGKFHSGYINAEEFEYAITSKNDPNDPTTWDWAPAVEAASQYLITTGSGGVICLPRLGPCRHTGIKLHSGVSLIGHGGGTHMLHIGLGNAFEWIGDTSGDTAPRQQYKGSARRLKRMTVQNFISEGNSGSQNGFHLAYTEKFGRGNVAFRDMEIVGHGQDGIYWTFGDNLTLDNVFSLYNRRHGLYVFQNSNSLHIDGGSYTANGARGIYLNQVASSCKIDGATIHDNATNGIYAQRAEQPLIYNCQFNGNGFSTDGTHAAIALIGDSTKIVEGGIVEGCLFGDNAPNGADVQTVYVKSVALLSNYVFNVNASKPYIFRLGGESRGVVIRGTRWNITAGTPERVSIPLGQEANVDYILEDDEAQNASTGLPDSTKRVDNLWNQFLEYRLRNPNNVLFQTRSTGSEAKPYFLITGRGLLSWNYNGDAASPTRTLGINSDHEIAASGRVRSDLGFVTDSSSWSARPLRLGNFVLWFDATGALRKKNGTPSGDLDGELV
jgi:parallel beta-helix repeat protein